MTGYEPPRIPGGGEHTDSWGHTEIKDAFEPLDTTSAIEQAERYWQMHQLWEQGVSTFARSIQTSISQAWSGPAAEASKNSIQTYATDAHTLTPALAELHTRVRDAATAIVNTKKAIPDTVNTSIRSRIFHPSRWNLDREQSEETQKARVAMNEHYVQPFNQIDGKIPVLPTPTSPTKALDITPPPGGYKTDEGGTGGQPTQPKTPGTDPNSKAPGDNNGGQPGDPSNPNKESTEQPKTEQTTPASTSPSNTQTTPASTTPTTTNPGTPTSTDPTKTVPTSTGTPHSPGTPGSPTTRSPSSPGSPTTRTPQPGRSVPGTPSTPGTTANPAAAAATSATRGATGTPGVGGMGAGARGGKSEDDSEHKIPDYLITQENTDELLGELPRTIPGGVIGGDIPT
ncbi:hypothetical protein DFR70_110125 [Nocardia tenerifensis]|uniref:PPE family protein n=1 Tax=Nocardia tenerifensis TaxID=228006 RepID=A0A318K0J5_9NOCA|nr:hypothetical protein [Nocardia tenerifensis]PXX60285.1 hypothetical protein DFR70_110125 [Nocardia tenerifensis]